MCGLFLCHQASCSFVTCSSAHSSYHADLSTLYNPSLVVIWVILQPYVYIPCFNAFPTFIHQSAHWTVFVVLPLSVSDSIVMQTGSCALSMLSRLQCVCMGACVCVEEGCCAALNADQLWALVMSHTVMSHEEGWTKRRGREDGQTKELYKCSVLMLP